MAGMMALALSVLGSVFTTQSQLYDAKDNELLLSMPIKPGMILLSRMVPLLALNLLFTGIVMVPAIVMYAIFAKFSLPGLLCQLISLLAVCLIAQAIACLLGWLLHLLLSRANKSLASLIFMVAFLGVYFTVYSQAGEILQAIALNGQQIADTLQTWVWPLYAMGVGCLGSIPQLLIFAAIAAALFAVVYFILSVTFLRTATAKRGSVKKAKLNTGKAKVYSPTKAVVYKELRKFLGCPVYLTNMGLGVILTVALPVAGIIFKDSIVPVLALLDPAGTYLPAAICGILALSVSTACISTPSVSLEGKSLWILKSMPIPSKSILLGKLYFHCWMTVPAASLSGLILAITYGCTAPGILLCALIPGLLAVLTGLIGMWAGLMWAKFDYISEAYPCKQSVSVLISMFAPWGLLFLLFILFILLDPFVPMIGFLCLSALILLALCFALYRVMIGWGVKKWDALQP
jgi:ABC-2 type transport system permease protein